MGKKRWRPEGWERLKIKTILQCIAGADPGEPDLDDIFEAGADAILETLFKLAEEYPAGTFEIDSHRIVVYRGARVIPD